MSEKKAYILQGHGSEEEDTFLVPPGCLIVVKTMAGCTTQSYTILEKGLCSLTPAILKDPIAHYDDLERVFGSLAIYQAGDTCPSFHYSLLHCYQMSDIYWTGCNSFGSGVMDIDQIYADKALLECTRNMDPSRRRFRNQKEFGELDASFDHDSVYDSVYPYLSTLFQHSVFPTPDDIEIIVHQAIDDNVTEKDAMMEYIANEVSITQEELCDLFPGVYYHVICRATPTGMNLFHSSMNERYKIPSRVTYLSSQPPVRNLLRKHIGEAVAHRAPYLRRMYEMRYATPIQMPPFKKGPSRATRRRRQQRQRQKQKQRTAKNRNNKHNA